MNWDFHRIVRGNLIGRNVLSICNSILLLYLFVLMLQIDFLFLKAGKKKGDEIIQAWAASIRNHFWHCSNECGGDLKKMKVCYTLAY